MPTPRKRAIAKKTSAKKKTTKKKVVKNPLASRKQIDAQFLKQYNKINKVSLNLVKELSRLSLMVINKKPVSKTQITEINNRFRKLLSLSRELYAGLIECQGVLGKDRVYAFTHELYHKLVGPYFEQKKLIMFDPKARLLNLKKYYDFAIKVQSYG